MKKNLTLLLITAILCYENAIAVTHGPALEDEIHHTAVEKPMSKANQKIMKQNEELKKTLTKDQKNMIEMFERNTEIAG